MHSTQQKRIDEMDVTYQLTFFGFFGLQLFLCLGFHDKLWQIDAFFSLTAITCQVCGIFQMTKSFLQIVKLKTTLFCYICLTINIIDTGWVMQTKNGAFADLTTCFWFTYFIWNVWLPIVQNFVYQITFFGSILKIDQNEQFVSSTFLSKQSFLTSISDETHWYVPLVTKAYRDVEKKRTFSTML